MTNEQDPFGDDPDAGYSQLDAVRRQAVREAGHAAPLSEPVERHARVLEAIESTFADEGWKPTARLSRTAHMAASAVLSLPVTEPVDGLRVALEAIRDMEPELVDESLPDHSECAECKRWEGHPVQQGRCDDLYRAIHARQERGERARQAQQHRMRDVARAALAQPGSRETGLDAEYPESAPVTLAGRLMLAMETAGTLSRAMLHEGILAVEAALAQPGPRETGLDVEARRAHIRAEHEATHGEAEMCGAECIALGLAEFDDEADPLTEPVDGLRAFAARIKACKEMGGYEAYRVLVDDLYAALAQPGPRETGLGGRTTAAAARDVAVANRVLDRPYADPDDDAAQLARAVLRLTGRWTTERQPEDDAECERLGCEDKTHPVHHFVMAAQPGPRETGPDSALAADGLKWRAAEAEGHIVAFSESGYGLQHPPSCRPNLIGCEFNAYLAGQDEPKAPPGRYTMRGPFDGIEGPSYVALADTAESGEAS